MEITQDILKKLLIESGYVKEQDFDAAAKEAADFDKNIVDVLIFKGLVTEELQGKLIAKHLGVPYASIRNKLIPEEIIDLIPEKVAHSYKMIPFEKEGDELHVAMEDPTNFEALEFTKRKTGLKVVPYYISSADLKKVFGQYKRDIKQEFNEIIEENIKKTTKLGKDVVKAAEELPVIKILDTILEYAIALRTSDIHIETSSDVIIVRFRVDGILKDIINLPKAVQAAIVARIKILASLKLDEHRTPQDGRFKYQTEEEAIALRVSILPAYYGENVVLRLLA